MTLSLRSTGPLLVGATDDDNNDLLAGLAQQIGVDSGDYDYLDTYYNGLSRLEALGMALPPEMRLLQVVVNWPRMVVDSIAERMTVTGFRLGDSAESDARMWSWWQANNLDEESRLEHVEALVQKRGYITVGQGEEPDEPLITVETRRNMAVDLDPRTRSPRAALRLYGYDETNPNIPTLATLYLRDANDFYETDPGSGQWVRYDSIEHNMGRVTVVPLVNRARIGDRYGRSEMDDVIGLTDACCRSITNLQAAQELLAVPQRYLLGATRDDFKDQDGNLIPAWEAYIGRYAMLANDQAKAGQFPSADLSNFTTVVNIYAQLVAGLAGLPPSYLGLNDAANPASADAIRSAEARLVMRIYDRENNFSGAWEQAMRLGIGWVDGEIPPQSRALQTLWANPETPTFAAKADAVTKLVSAGIMPPEAALEELGYSDQQRARWAGMRTSDPITHLANSVLGAGGATVATETNTNTGRAGQNTNNVIAANPVLE